MKDKLIILDFDHTVFNTTLYVARLKQEMKDLFRIPEDVFMEKRQEVKDCCVVVDIDKFIKLLPHDDKQALHDLHHKVIKEHAAEFVFNDVSEFITNHLEDFDILLLTHGNKELQTEKITHSNLPSGVEHIISINDKDEVIKDKIKEYQKVYFVDDKSKNVDRVKTAFPDVVTYFVVRPEDSPYGEIKSQCDCADYTVEGLKFVIRP